MRAGMDMRPAGGSRPIWREVRLGETTVRYEVAGAGEPLVLVHGLSGSTRWWARNVPALAARYRVHLVDLPGFGGLRRLRKEFALAHAAEWLLRWMDAVGLERPHLIGHSMGGLIGIRCAAHFPQRIHRLVLAAPASLPAGGSLAGEFVSLATALRYATPSFLPVLAYDAVRSGPVTLLRAARDILRAEAQADLRAVTAPTPLIWGERDALVPPSIGAVLRREIPDARLLLIPAPATCSCGTAPARSTPPCWPSSPARPWASSAYTELNGWVGCASLSASADGMGG